MFYIEHVVVLKNSRIFWGGGLSGVRVCRRGGVCRGWGFVVGWGFVGGGGLS